MKLTRRSVNPERSDGTFEFESALPVGSFSISRISSARKSGATTKLVRVEVELIAAGPVVADEEICGAPERQRRRPHRHREYAVGRVRIDGRGAMKARSERDAGQPQTEVRGIAAQRVYGPCECIGNRQSLGRRRDAKPDQRRAEHVARQTEQTRAGAGHLTTSLDDKSRRTSGLFWALEPISAEILDSHQTRFGEVQSADRGPVTKMTTARPLGKNVIRSATFAATLSLWNSRPGSCA